MIMDIGSILQGAAAFGGTMLGGLGLSSQQQANEQNMRLNRELLAFQKYQYSDMKRYNSMAEQVRRIKAAGLNPALLMQSGNVGMSAQPVSSPSVTPMNPLDVAGAGSAISDIANLGSSMSLADAQRENVKANTEKTRQDVVSATINNKYLDDMNKWGIDKLKSESMSHGALAELNWARRNLALNEFKIASETQKDQIQKIKLDRDLTAAHYEAAAITASLTNAKLRAEIQRDLANALFSVKSGYANARQAEAAFMDATTRRIASNAQYGTNKADWYQFRQLLWNKLEAEEDKYYSESYHNTVYGNSYKVGSDFFGNFSVTNNDAHTSDFDSWKQDKKARNQQKRQRRIEHYQRTGN